MMYNVTQNVYDLIQKSVPESVKSHFCIKGERMGTKFQRSLKSVQTGLPNGIFLIMFIRKNRGAESLQVPIFPCIYVPAKNFKTEKKMEYFFSDMHH